MSRVTEKRKVDSLIRTLQSMMEEIKPSDGQAKDGSLAGRRKVLQDMFEQIDRDVKLHSKIPEEDHLNRIKNKQHLNKLVQEASEAMSAFGQELDKQASKVKTDEQKQSLEAQVSWWQNQSNVFLNRVEEVRRVCEGIVESANRAGAGASSRTSGKGGRKGRHQKSNRLRSVEDIELESIGVEGPASAQEQAFMEEVAQNWQQEDQMLEEISQTLSHLLILAQRINKKLKVIAGAIEDVEVKMDRTQERLDNANERMEKMLEESGGMSRWCPICICLILILACVAFIYTKAK